MIERNYPIGFSTCGRKPLDEESFRQYKEIGIDALELSDADYATYDFKKLKEYSSEYEIQLWSLHIPFWPFDKIDPSSPDADLRQHTLDFMMDFIRRGSAIGIDKYIVHPSGEPISDELREEKIKCSMDTLYKLAESAAAYGAVVAVEDLPRTCLGRDSQEINRLISANDKLRVCFDTNHLLTEDNTTFIKNVGSKIITTHVSDYDFLDEKHWLPGEGDIDWQALLQALSDINYDGVWMYEIGFPPERTIQRRMLTAKDFHDNAQALFRGEIPMAIGERILSR